MGGPTALKMAADLSTAAAVFGSSFGLADLSTAAAVFWSSFGLVFEFLVDSVLGSGCGARRFKAGFLELVFS